MSSSRTGPGPEKSVQMMNSSRELNQRENGQAYQKLSERLRRERFQITLVGCQDCSLHIICHLTEDAKFSFELCFMKCVQKSPGSLEQISC